MRYWSEWAVRFPLIAWNSTLDESIWKLNTKLEKQAAFEGSGENFLTKFDLLSERILSDQAEENLFKRFSLPRLNRRTKLASCESQGQYYVQEMPWKFYNLQYKEVRNFGIRIKVYTWIRQLKFMIKKTSFSSASDGCATRLPSIRTRCFLRRISFEEFFAEDSAERRDERVALSECSLFRDLSYKIAVPPKKQNQICHLFTNLSLAFRNKRTGRTVNIVRSQMRTISKVAS